MGGEVDAEVAGVREVVDRLPVAAVHDDDERVGPVAGREAQVAELERLVRRRRRGRRRPGAVGGEDVDAVTGHVPTDSYRNSERFVRSHSSS